MRDKLFAGLNGFLWWFGTVEYSSDPLSLGRVKVRIVGHHNPDINELPTDALPYASVILPTDAGTIGGVGSTYNIPVGSRVFGFFLDGDMRMQPAVLGVLTGQHISCLTNANPINSAPQQPNINPLLGTSTNNVEQSCPTGSLATVNVSNMTRVDWRNLKFDKSQFVYPCTGYVSDYYGSRNGRHFGVDLASISPQTSAGSKHLAGRYRGGTGDPIFAIADGVVTQIFKHSEGQKQGATNYDVTGQGSRSFGNAVMISHNVGGQIITAIYAHLGSNQDAGLDTDSSGVLVTAKQTVKKGQQIGTRGRTHNFSTPTHLHFELHLGNFEPHGINTFPPSIIFPKMANVDTSILSWVNNTLTYNLVPPFTPAQMQFQALEIPQ